MSIHPICLLPFLNRISFSFKVSILIYFQIDVDLGSLGEGSFVQSVFSILLLVKLMVKGHPRARPYYHEICNRVHPNMIMQAIWKIILAVLKRSIKTRKA